MSGGPGTFAYAQARLQARWGARAADADLQRIRAARDVATLLQQVRTTALARYVARIAPGLPTHELERRMRAEWTALVDEVAAWVPQRWREPVRWLRWLPWLPALQKLGRGGRAAAWTREDPVLGSIVAEEPGSRALAVRDTELAPLQSALASAEGDVTRAWVEHWRSLWPARATERAGVAKVLRAFAEHDDMLRGAPSGAATEEFERTLAHRLLTVFRRHPQSPAAAVAFLAAEGLDLLALRGALLARAAFEPVAA